MKQFLIKYSYLFTVFFFVVGFFNIIFAWIGFLCMILPFVFAVKDGKNTWCQSYCPRANLFSRLFKKLNFNIKPIPKFLHNGKGRTVMLIYFAINIFLICMSTLMVFLDKRPPLDKVRFLIAFQFPWNIPQYLDIGVMSEWVVHMGFRFYSMMFTTVIIGLLLGLLYRPRTWCAVCPMGTMTNRALKSQKVTLKIE